MTPSTAASKKRRSSHTAWAINELVVEAAVKLGVEDGSKLRVDTTVVETDIHHPTDNTLLWDVELGIKAE
jgi:IS5 family transposase